MFRVVLPDGSTLPTTYTGMGDARRARKAHPGSHIEAKAHDGWRVIK